MQRISLETFFSVDADLEINQYRILGGIKEINNDFEKKKIYPALAQLIYLNNSLKQIHEERESLNGKFPKAIKGLDLKEQKLIFTVPSDFEKYKNVDQIFELIEWTLPYLKDAIEEGIVLYEFIEKNISFSQVGILPVYKDEGYFMITDNIAFELQVHRYECSLFSSEKEKYRALKTELVKSEKQEILRRSPESIKHELIKERQDLPNPATFICDTDLDFPFMESIFPVAKRKLMSVIAS
jgi:hypothetical protein